MRRSVRFRSNFRRPRSNSRVSVIVPDPSVGFLVRTTVPDHHNLPRRDDWCECHHIVRFEHLPLSSNVPSHHTQESQYLSYVRDPLVRCVQSVNFAAQLTSPTISQPAAALLSPKWSAPELLASPVHWQIAGAVAAPQPRPRARCRLDQPGHWAGEKVYKRSTIRQISCMLHMSYRESAAVCDEASICGV